MVALGAYFNIGIINEKYKLIFSLYQINPGKTAAIIEIDLKTFKFNVLQKNDDISNKDIQNYIDTYKEEIMKIYDFIS